MDVSKPARALSVNDPLRTITSSFRIGLGPAVPQVCEGNWEFTSENSIMISTEQWVALAIFVAGIFAVFLGSAQRNREKAIWQTKVLEGLHEPAPEESASDEPSGCGLTAEQPEIIIILVHGTWAPDALWTRSSPLRNYLLEHLEFVSKAKVATQTCRWSGENSFVGRARAAEGLRHQLEKNAALYPNALQFIIAHSHGGNIALLALEKVKVKVAGTICLSTPIIVVTGGHIGGEEHFDWILSASAGTLVFFCLWLYWPTVLALWFLAQWMSLRPYDTDEIYLSMRSPDFDKLDRENVLLIRSHGDEATLALASVSFVNWLSENLMRWPLSRTPGLARFLMRLALSIVFAPVPLMLIIAARAFGPEAAFNFPRKRVHIESSPPGYWTVYGLRTLENSGDDPEQMFRHSRAYQSENSSAIVLRFIRDRLLSSRARRADGAPKDGTLDAPLPPGSG